MYTIGTNVCPVVGRLVDCASNHEITLRYRNPVTTTLTSFRHPSRALANATLSLFRDFISCWNSYRDLTVIHFYKEISKNFSLASLILHFFVNENCENILISFFPLFLKEILKSYWYFFITLFVSFSRTDKPRMQIVQTNSEIISECHYWPRHLFLRISVLAEIIIVNVHGTQRYCYFLRGNTLLIAILYSLFEVRELKFIDNVKYSSLT